MKLFVLFVVFYISTLQVNAQFSKNHHIYSKVGFNVGTHLGGEIYLSYVFKEKYSLDIGVNHYIQTSRIRPNDYQSGLLSFLSLDWSDGNDIYKDAQILVGRVILMNETTRFNIKAGIGYTQVNHAVNFTPISNAILGPNYSYERHQFYTTSFILNPIFEITSSQIAGFYLSSIFIVNKETIVFGFGFGLMYGLLRSPRRRR